MKDVMVEEMCIVMEHCGDAGIISDLQASAVIYMRLQDM